MLLLEDAFKHAFFLHRLAKGRKQAHASAVNENSVSQAMSLSVDRLFCEW